MAPTATKDGAWPETTGGSTFFGHPRGLATLFMTEMWERFSFYGMRALLVLYLISGGPDANPENQGGGLAMPEASAIAIYSVYLAMVYLLAMPGGWFGDRLWGPRKTVAIAGGIIMLGHFSLAVPGEAMFFVGLGLVALGSGLLKANISTMVGQLYDGPQDPRRDGGFTLFYIGINLGGFAAPLVIGTIGQQINWHLGFAAAGVGMGLGLIQFLLGSKHLSPRSSHVPAPLAAEERRSWLRKGLLWLAVAAAFYGAVAFSGHFSMNWVVLPITVLGLVIPVAVLVRIKRDKELSGDEQSRMNGYIWFFVAAAAFWMIYDQGGSTLAAFAETKTAGSVFGVHFPSSWFQSVNPLYIMALAPLFAWAWLALARRNREPSTTVKFAMALLLIGVSFFIFVVPMLLSDGGGKVSPMWLLSIYLAQTIGELCLSPVGLSITTKLAPAKYASQMMGVWFLAVTAGDCVTSLLSTGGVDLSGPGAVLVEAGLAVLAGVAVFFFRKRVETLTGDVH
ncbi:peptide MFS transporter [Streptomyces sp. TP-A0874]|uniref:peptide MFS transporter n=1 Tax=Streptomyces sp. TP-A0874 TaxID=549819 RepID=UPI000852FCC8|nr:oligopeptide:H+ symporter [Streptomyces sp. TP-A0874]